MAVLGKIRNATGLMLVVVLGATAAFILEGFVSGASNGGAPVVGSINGEDVEVQEYQNLVGKYEAVNPNATRAGAENQAWNDMMFKYAWKPHLEASGIVVTKDLDGDESSEEFDMMQGKTLHKSFFNQNSQNLPHVAFVEQFSGIISNIMESGPSQQNQSYGMLMRQKDNFYNDRLRDKYTSLFTNATYVTTAEARRDVQGQGVDAAQSSIEYVYLPFRSFNDSSLKATDAEMSAYVKKHSNEFKVSDSRSIDYVAFSYRASQEDKEALLAKANDLTVGLTEAASAQEFVNTNSDVTTPITLQEYASLPTQLKSDSANLVEGKVYGPYFSGKKYQSFKITRIRAGEGVSKTSFSAILVDTSRIADDKVAGALDSASQLLVNALANPDDVSLGWSPSTVIESTDSLQLPKEVISRLFETSEAGVYPELLAVPAGVVVIKKDKDVEPAATKYGVASLELELYPSQVTRDSVWEVAAQLIGVSSTVTELEEAVKLNNALRLENANKVLSTSSNLGRYNGSDVRDIISWSFQNEVNTISGDVFDIVDQETYIIAAVKGATEKDVVTVDAVKSELTSKVEQEKKGAKLKEVLAAQSGKTFDEMVSAINTAYPGLASTNKADNIGLGSRFISNFSYGYEPTMIGAAIGLNEGETSPVLVGEQGVFIIKVTSKTAASDKKDYSADKKQLASSKKFGESSKLSRAIEDLTEVVDERYKY